MCGINGYYNYLHKNIANHDALVRKMNDVLAHRGPDDQGTWSDPGHKIIFAISERKYNGIEVGSANGSSYMSTILGRKFTISFGVTIFS